jgi:uncharacterized protein with FMN-binding domain
VNVAIRRVTFAVAGSAVAALMLIGFKGTQGTAGTQAGGTTGDNPVGGEGSGGIPVKTGRATVPGGSFTADGSVVSTPFGPIQVRLHAAGTRISDVTILRVPNDRGRSTEINGYATPLLHREVLRAQSADVDVISGATYTSYAYAQSLQAALDAAAQR